MTDEDRKLAVQRVGEYAMGLLGDGVLTGGSPLHPIEEAKKIRTREGVRRVLDGPFAESKGGSSRATSDRAPDIDTAVAIAERCPNAEFGSVEVREIVPMG